MSQCKLTIDNRQRAARCLKAIAAYSVDDAFTTLVDMLADAMHFCDFTEHDFPLALAQACWHYIHERNDQPDGARRMSHD